MLWGALTRPQKDGDWKLTNQSYSSATGQPSSNMGQVLRPPALARRQHPSHGDTRVHQPGWMGSPTPSMVGAGHDTGPRHHVGPQDTDHCPWEHQGAHPGGTTPTQPTMPLALGTWAHTETRSRGSVATASSLPQVADSHELACPHKEALLRDTDTAARGGLSRGYDQVNGAACWVGATPRHSGGAAAGIGGGKDGRG